MMEGGTVDVQELPSCQVRALIHSCVSAPALGNSAKTGSHHLTVRYEVLKYYSKAQEE